MFPFQLLIAALGGWLHREQADLMAFLREENRLLRARLAGQRLRFDDRERRRLADWATVWVAAGSRRSRPS